MFENERGKIFSHNLSDRVFKKGSWLNYYNNWGFYFIGVQLKCVMVL